MSGIDENTLVCVRPGGGSIIDAAGNVTVTNNGLTIGAAGSGPFGGNERAIVCPGDGRASFPNTTFNDVGPPGTLDYWIKGTSSGVPGGDRKAGENLILLGIGSVAALYTNESLTYGFYSSGSHHQIGLFEREGHTKYIDNAWHFVRIVFDGVNAPQIAVDGVDKSAYTTFHDGADSSSHFLNHGVESDFYLGGYYDGYWTGELFDFRLSSIARPLTEVPTAPFSAASTRTQTITPLTGAMTTIN